MYPSAHVFTKQDQRTPRGLHQMRCCSSLEHLFCVQQHQTQHPLQLLGAQVPIVILLCSSLITPSQLVWHRCVWFRRHLNLTSVQYGVLTVFIFLQSCQSKDMDEKIKSYRQAIFKLDHAERIQRKRDESGVSASQDQSMSLTFWSLLPWLHSPSTLCSMLHLCNRLLCIEQL